MLYRQSLIYFCVFINSFDLVLIIQFKLYCSSIRMKYGNVQYLNTEKLTSFRVFQGSSSKGWLGQHCSATTGLVRWENYRIIEARRQHKS